MVALTADSLPNLKSLMVVCMKIVIININIKNKKYVKKMEFEYRNPDNSNVKNRLKQTIMGLQSEFNESRKGNERISILKKQNINLFNKKPLKVYDIPRTVTF